jgi:hypothetical protein
MVDLGLVDVRDEFLFKLPTYVINILNYPTDVKRENLCIMFSIK